MVFRVFVFLYVRWVIWKNGMDGFGDQAFWQGGVKKSYAIFRGRGYSAAFLDEADGQDESCD